LTSLKNLKDCRCNIHFLFHFHYMHYIYIFLYHHTNYKNDSIGLRELLFSPTRNNLNKTPNILNHRSYSTLLVL